MTLDELQALIKATCEETARNVYRAKREGSDKIYAIFQAHRDDIFKISQRLPEHWETEVFLKEQAPDTYSMLRSTGLAFITCSCGSREDSCAEDGDGNFSTFIFAPDGKVYRKVEKKP